MSELHAFELRPPLTLDELVGASVAFGPQAQHLDIKQALEDGSGRIVTNHPDVIATLRGFYDLEEVTLENPAEHEVTPLSVALPEVQGAPIEFTPEAPTDPNLPTVADPLLPPDPGAVHGDEPADMEEAAQQPASQAQAQAQRGQTLGEDDDDPDDDEDDE